MGVFLVSHLEEGVLAAGGDPSALRRAVQLPLALGLGSDHGCRRITPVP